MAKSNFDRFGPKWDMVDDEHVSLVRVLGSMVVPMSKGFVALQIETPPPEYTKVGDPTAKTQTMMSPDYAERLGTSLIEAARMARKSN